MSGSASNVATDTTPPYLVDSPEVNYPVGAKVIFTFTEAIKLGPGTITFWRVDDEFSTYKAEIAGNPRVTVSGNTLIFDPPFALTPKTGYGIRIAPGAILDLAGNPLTRGEDFIDFFETGISPTPVTATGTALSDKIHGSDFADTLSGGSDGYDRLYGYGGDDVLDGGDETPSTTNYTDQLYGGAGNDILYGRGGNDELWGDDGDDKLYGGADNDRLIGGAGNDLLDGGEGDDRLGGSGGNDVLAGGAGFDRAEYSGLRKDYKLTRNPDGSITITDTRSSSPEGIDTLTSIEYLGFFDGLVAIDIDGSAGQAYRIYRAAFDRAPDLGGMGFYLSKLEKGVSLYDVAASFVASQEFKDMYGSAPSNAEIVTRLYKNILHREPEPGGYAFWLDVLDSKRADLPTVLAAFSEGPENRAATAELIANGVPFEMYWG
jgi:hypothetical protein